MLKKVRLRKDLYDNDMAQLYIFMTSSLYSRGRHLLCCSMHTDAISDVFGTEVAANLENKGEIVIQLTTEILNEE